MKTLKVLLTISFLVIFTFGSFAQRKTVTTLSTDTIANTTPVYSDVLTTKMADNLNFQVLCTQIGGTSDGTVELQGSVDGTSYLALGSKGGFTAFFPSDTLTVTNGAIMNVAIKDNPYKYLRFKFTGTANDTTQLVVKYTIAN